MMEGKSLCLRGLFSALSEIVTAFVLPSSPLSPGLFVTNLQCHFQCFERSGPHLSVFSFGTPLPNGFLMSNK